MADLISRLKLESGEFDSKIKRAGQELLAYSEHCKKTGLQMGFANKDAKEFAKALGDMNTVSQTARGKLNELTEVFVNLKTMYNGMTDAEKKNTFGKELATSLDKLKNRIDEAKQNLNSVNAELGNTKQAGDSAKGGIEGLTSALGINVKSLVSWGAAIGAAKGALDVAKDAFFASEKNVDEWGRIVQSSQSLYEGFLNAINNGDISGYLSRMGEIVSAARAAYDEMDRLGTMRTIQKPQMSKKQAEMDRYRAMLQTGRWIGAADGRQSSLGYKEGDVMSKEHLKVIEQQLQSGMNELVGLHKNEVRQQTKAIDAEYKSMAADLGMSLEEFRRGTSSMEKFDEMIAGARRLKQWEAEHTGSYNSQTKTYNMTAPTPKELEKYRGWDNFRVDGERYNRLADFIQQRDQHMSQVYQMQGQTYRTINRAEGTTVRGIMGNGGSGSGTSPQEQAQKQVEAALLAYNQTIEKAKLETENGYKSESDVKKATLSAQERLYDAYGKAYATYADPKYKEAQDAAAKEIKKLGGEVKATTEAQKAAEQAAREQEAAAKKLADAQDRLVNALESGDLKQIYAAQKGVETAHQGVIRAVGTVSNTPAAVEVPVGIKYTTGNMEAFIGQLKEELSKTEVGTEVFNKITEQLSDATSISEILSTALQNGISEMPFDSTALLQRIMNKEDIQDTEIQGYVATLNDQLKAALDETEWPKVLIRFNADTNSITNMAKQQQKEAQEMARDWNEAGQAIQAVGQAMSAIEDPAAKVLGTIAQAVASIALGAGQAIAQAGNGSAGGPWGWIAFAAAATATMISTISAVHSATGYAQGGIVDGRGGGFVGGTAYSGDNVGNVRLDSGELVLNKAQTNNLANALHSDSESPVTSLPYVSGQTIFLGTNNYLKASGQGEIVTTKTLKKYGLV